MLLVVPTDGAVTAALRSSPLGDVPARLTVTDRTPFPFRHPVRGLVQLSGWVDAGRRVRRHAAGARLRRRLAVRQPVRRGPQRHAGAAGPGGGAARGGRGDDRRRARRLPGRPPRRGEPRGERADGRALRGADPARDPGAAVGRPAATTSGCSASTASASASGCRAAAAATTCACRSPRRWTVRPGSPRVDLLGCGPACDLAGPRPVTQISRGQAARDSSARAASAFSKHSCGGCTSPAPT